MEEEAVGVMVYLSKGLQKKIRELAEHDHPRNKFKGWSESEIINCGLREWMDDTYWYCVASTRRPVG